MSDAKLAAIDPEPASLSVDNQTVEKSESAHDKPAVAHVESSKQTETSETPPLPSRPLSAIDMKISQLVDMFPTVDPKYIKMALIASEGRLEPASNALLFLSDPNSGIEISSIPSNQYTSTPNVIDQYESDEMLARKLAQSYKKKASNVSLGSAKPRKSHDTPSMNENRTVNNNFGNLDYDSDEDLYESFTKNVNEAKQIVGGWFGNISKKIQESIEQSPPLPPKRSNYLPQRPINLDNPYQKQPPQSVERSPHDNDNDNDDDDDDAPKLPVRKSTGILYPAVNHSDTSINIQTESDNKIKDAKTLPPKPVKKDTSEDLKIKLESADNKKDNQKWTPLKESSNNNNDEPSNDAFLVEDSEDENDEITEEKVKKEEDK